MSSLLLNAGCQKQSSQPQAPLVASLAAARVPNMPLDIYLYAKQSDFTLVPAEVSRGSQDVHIESLAVWGVSVEDDFALGMAVTFSGDDEASDAYAEILRNGDAWKKLSGDTLYLVLDSGLAAESLKTAISNDDFTYFDDSDSLQALAFLPDGSTTRLTAVAVAKRSDALINAVLENTGTREADLIRAVLKLVNLKIVAGGLYSAQEIDAAEIAGVIDGGGGIYDLDLGLLLLIRSGLPGFFVEPAVKKFLTEQEFTETSVGGLTLYKGYLYSGNRGPVVVRIEGNYIFVAVSGLESYAETIITSVHFD